MNDSEIPDPPPAGKDAVSVFYDGRWMSYEAFVKLRLDKLMPPQPKREWRRSGGRA